MEPSHYCHVVWRLTFEESKTTEKTTMDWNHHLHHQFLAMEACEECVG
jgi:hypothetical protein